MIIPFPAGGSIDIVGRSIAQRWSAQLNQQIVIDNRSGAAGVIGMQLVANAAADGYTLIYGNAGPLAIGPLLSTNVGYDSGTQRSTLLPDVQTCLEAGLPGFCGPSWHAILAPRTPKMVISKLHRSLAATLASPELREQLTTREDSVAVGGTPEDLARLLRSEADRFAKIIKSAGIRAE